MANKSGAYANKSSDTDFHKKWDREDYAERAKRKDVEERERVQENEEHMKQGKRPRKEDLPKPAELMKAREAPLELDKNLGKTMVIQNPGGRGPGQPGFYCEACNRTYKDSVGYLDHINSRVYLRALGQSTKKERSTVEQVHTRIVMLCEKTKEVSSAKAFDFDKRLAEINAREQTL
ncbi:Zinc finger matrin-type protein 2 [Leucoagaricus sp. SymC.cos]|nr:Zinc finger matrin-type protein 2 [Leucoagaricus sp. SymC.cos]